jgi:hypothetical protein
MNSQFNLCNGKLQENTINYNSLSIVCKVWLRDLQLNLEDILSTSSDESHKVPRKSSWSALERGGWRRVLKSSQDVVFIPALLTLHNFGQKTCCQVLEWQEISGCWEKPRINTDIIVTVVRDWYHKDWSNKVSYKRKQFSSLDYIWNPRTKVWNERVSVTNKWFREKGHKGPPH